MLIPLADSASSLGAEIGVFGGSGFYEFLDDPVEVELTTPFGPPSSTISVGTLAGRRVAFLARHGREPRLRRPPGPVPGQRVGDGVARRAVGDRPVFGRIVAARHPPRRLRGRRPADRPHDRAGRHVPRRRLRRRLTWIRPAGAPPELRRAVRRRAASRAGRRGSMPAASSPFAVHDGGTMVVINGPRFSTRAESLWFRQMGWSVVNMTGYPEAVLAAEANLPYATVALVTDYDAGVDGHEPVTMDAVFAVMRDNVANVQRADHRRPPRAAVTRRRVAHDRARRRSSISSMVVRLPPDDHEHDRLENHAMHIDGEGAPRARPASLDLLGGLPRRRTPPRRSLVAATSHALDEARTRSGQRLEPCSSPPRTILRATRSRSHRVDMPVGRRFRRMRRVDVGREAAIRSSANG